MMQNSYRTPVCALTCCSLILVAWPVSAQAQTNGADSPHGALSDDIDCSACHTATGWRPAKAIMDFDHDRATAFDLIGRHADATCSNCHIALRFDQPKLVNSDCPSCHVDVHQGKLSADCASCHNATSFVDVAGVSVHARTSFPLSGAHLQISCEGCHVDDRGGAFTTLDSDCFSCHQDDYQSAVSIDHAGLQFSTNCQDCHTTLGWGGGGGTFDHAAASGFNLLGAHTAAPCESCHVIPGLAPIFPTSDQDDCIACHEPDYNQAHGGDFPTDCLECHTNDSWSGASFDHVQASGGFQLLGAHAAAQCESCHVVPGFTSIYPTADQNDCVTCHQTDYDGVHGGGFPTDCVTCHTNDSWSGANFDHTQTSGGFTLVGAHAAATCESCHVLPGYQSLFGTNDQNDCIACHQADYDGEHAGSGFSTDCLPCHTQDSWSGAVAVDHDAQFFPIYSGKHQGKWNDDCTTCHTVPDNFQVFTCLECHEHRQDRMDNAHSDENGYVYESNACLSCHPDGRKP